MVLDVYRNLFKVAFAAIYQSQNTDLTLPPKMPNAL